MHWLICCIKNSKTLGIVVSEGKKKGILHQPRFHVRALCVIFLTCAFHGSGTEFGMDPYQEIFVLQRLVTLPSLMLLSKNEQFCPLTAGLVIQAHKNSYSLLCIQIHLNFQNFALGLASECNPPPQNRSEQNSSEADSERERINPTSCHRVNK